MICKLLAKNVIIWNTKIVIFFHKSDKINSAKIIKLRIESYLEAK